MDTKEAINNKTIMVTGGTGSFGNCFVERLLKDFNSKLQIVTEQKKESEIKSYLTLISEYNLKVSTLKTIITQLENDSKVSSL